MSPRVTTSAEELASLLDRDSGSIRSTLILLLEERAKGTPDVAIGERLLRELGRSIYATQILSHLLGAERVLLEIDAMERRMAATGASSPVGVERPGSAGAVGVRVPPMGGARSAVVPSTTFEEAVESIVSRRPALGAAYREAVRLNPLDRAFTMARAVSEEQLVRVRDAIGASLRNGATLNEAREAVAGLGDWTTSYAEVVYRNAVTRAYAEGRLIQARDPDVALVAPAVMFQAIQDADVRPNHAAAHGLAAGPDDPVWATLRPPLGHNCRCGLRLVDRIEAESLGILDAAGRVRPATVPPGARPDEGWRV